MNIDFQRDLRRIFIGVLSTNADADAKVAIEQMTEFELVACYLNWRRRMILPQPRRLIESKEFAVSKRHSTYCKQIDALLSEIESGKDITRHLSKLVLHAYVHKEAPKPLSPRRRPDLDLLLNDWGIHHLHISDEMEPGNTGFVKRDGPLLFAIFLQDRVYLLDILGHNDFANDHLLHVVAANWSNERLIVKLGVMPGATDTAKERNMLRSAGIATAAIIDGHAYVSGLTGGLTTAGTSTRNTHEAKQFLRRIIELETACKNPSFVLGLYSNVGVTCPTRPELRLASLAGGWGIVDAQTGHLLYLIGDR
jgi:hypothetical protein